MNIANKITLVRIFLVPVFVLFMLTDFTEYNSLIAFIVFVIATITDKIDGTIARKMNLVTDFGKFLDPIADKLLVSSALICLTADGTLPAWITIVIIGREFIISAFRLVCADTGKTVAATWWGKSKTIAQMVTIIVLLMSIPQLAILETILIYVSLALTIISLVDYFVKNMGVLKECSK
jgi:CDP-diacylglycerol--glycerol-3-phosphate 3-phosphatidyltransferase